ncbi:hypothetical protein LUZ63_007851 [Rhynchospora breviuscula]|uniref:Uncharacterized protein n=1 Tax=Rhynchospora breviuscula TaxID=2022672 RepID=A0A9Q0CSG4_9POAL|nr:hypothetical protein LUZ63_007851 [Rhynchospora breviuscula]
MQAVSKSFSPRLIRISKTHLAIAIRRATLSQASGAGDTKVHSGDPPGEAPSDDYPEMPAKFSGAEEAQEKGEDHVSGLESLPTTDDPKVKVPPFAPSGKLESHEVTIESEGPFFQQKRRLACSAKRDPHEVESDRKYYEKHKPSPLSHIEFADTRKPFRKATDGKASASEVEGGEGRGILLEDTVDAALERAERMFREAATRGVPEWPHSQALQRMLRMREQQGEDANSKGIA